MSNLKPQLGDFYWQDPFLVENQLSEDDRMLRDAAAQFAKKELQPSIVEVYREAHIQPELFKRTLIGNYTEDKDLHKRPMSKFVMDIAKDLGLI